MSSESLRPWSLMNGEGGAANLGRLESWDETSPQAAAWTRLQFPSDLDWLESTFLGGYFGAGLITDVIKAELLPLSHPHVCLTPPTRSLCACVCVCVCERDHLMIRTSEIKDSFFDADQVIFSGPLLINAASS